MKIMAAYNSGNQEDGMELKTMTWPDSAMILSGKPLFLPEDEGLTIMFGIGARITAVGKSIKPKFAHRYYNELAPMAFILKTPVAEALKKGADPKACDIMADYTVICGEAVEASEASGSSVFNATLSPLKGGENAVASFNADNTQQLLAGAISKASELNTVKTGDIVGRIFDIGIKAKTDSLLKVEAFGREALIENKLK